MGSGCPAGVTGSKPALLGLVSSLLALPGQCLWGLSLPFLLQAESLICHLFHLSPPDTRRRQRPEPATPASALQRAGASLRLCFPGMLRGAGRRVTLGFGADVPPAATGPTGAPAPGWTGARCTHGAVNLLRARWQYAYLF